MIRYYQFTIEQHGMYLSRNEALKVLRVAVRLQYGLALDFLVKYRMSVKRTHLEIRQTEWSKNGCFRLVEPATKSISWRLANGKQLAECKGYLNEYGQPLLEAANY